MKNILEFLSKNIDITCMKKKLLVISLLLITTFGAFAQTTRIYWNSNLDFALKLSKTQNKPIVVFFMDDPAGTLSSSVLNNTLGNNVISEKISNNFVPLKIQGDTTLQRQYNIQKIPTLLVLNKDGEEMDRLQGVIGIDQTFGLLENAQKNFENQTAGTSSSVLSADDADIVKVISYSNGIGTFYKTTSGIWIHKTSFYEVEYKEFSEDDVHYYIGSKSPRVYLAVPKKTKAPIWKFDLEENKWLSVNEIVNAENADANR